MRGALRRPRQHPGKEQRHGVVPPAPSRVFQVAWELPPGSEPCGGGRLPPPRRCRPHSRAPAPWVPRTPAHPRGAAANCDAWEPRGGRCPSIPTSDLSDPHLWDPGAAPQPACRKEAFTPRLSRLPLPRARAGAPIFPSTYGNGPSSLADPHPTSNKAQTVSTPLAGGEQAGFVGPLPVPGCLCHHGDPEPGS